MATYGPALLSGAAAGGRLISIGATATPGTVIHTAVTGTSGFDELYVYAANVTASSATLTVEWGGTGNPADHLVHQYTIPPNSPPLPIVTGQRVNGGLVIAAFSGTANAITISGAVNIIR